TRPPGFRSDGQRSSMRRRCRVHACIHTYAVPRQGRRGQRPGAAPTGRAGRSHRPGVVLAGPELRDVGAEVGREGPVVLLPFERPLDEPAEVAADALVADQRPGLSLVGPVLRLQPMALVEVADRSFTVADAPEVVGELEVGGSLRVTGVAALRTYNDL